MRETLDEWLTTKGYVVREWAISYLEKRGFHSNYSYSEYIEKSRDLENSYGDDPKYILTLRNLKSAYRQTKHKNGSDKKTFSTMISEESHAKIRDIAKKRRISISQVLEEMIDKETKRSQKTDKELLKERKRAKATLAALRICFYLLKNKNYSLSKQAVDLKRQGREFPSQYYEEINHLNGLCIEEDKEALRKSGAYELPSYPPSSMEVSILVKEYNISPPRMFLEN